MTEAPHTRVLKHRPYLQYQLMTSTDERLIPAIL